MQLSHNTAVHFCFNYWVRVYWEAQETQTKHKVSNLYINPQSSVQQIRAYSKEATEKKKEKKTVFSKQIPFISVEIQSKFIILLLRSQTIQIHNTVQHYYYFFKSVLSALQYIKDIHRTEPELQSATRNESRIKTEL